jgi:quinolinate synthase
MNIVNNLNDISSVRNMNFMFKEAKNFNQNLTIWQALKDNLDDTVFLRSASLIKYCGSLKDLSPEYINSYLSKRELELKKQLTKTGRLGLKKNLQTTHTDNSSIQVAQYKLLSDFKALKDSFNINSNIDINTR